ncbi:hypothetical protein ASPCAL01280 [Aspergillus calidoustus]|uniref:Uncharacterized protein n=1 Tax=Aspergillus calidoustus TaxID=454130 RepID=A0A0U4YX99_ASPCI|nr:hypothetical protein ASPCAL01280 [Aspergillus calidoustus]
MTTTSPNPPWVLKKKVLVYAFDLDVFCVTRLSIDHDQTANQGSISLLITADLANLNGRSKVLTLNIPLETVEKCGLARRSNDDLCPPRLVPMLPAPVTNVSAVSTLSLSLGTTGTVLCPSDMESLSPATPGDLNFHSFAKICQSKFLRVHFSGRQFVNSELDQLQSFSSALRQRRLQTVSYNHARHGVVQKDWRVFRLSPDPPPYCQEPVPEQVNQVDPPLYSESEQNVGKRRRDPRSISPDVEGRKRLLLPSPHQIGSPTEVNTPSTLPVSPSSIRPTYFTRAISPGHTECKRLALLEHELRGVSDDMIRELLIRSGRQHLLAIPKDGDRNLPCEFEQVSSSEVEMIERRLKRYIDSAVSECRDQIYDVYTTNEAEFREQVDDGNSEVRNTATECMNELKEQAQGHMLEIEEQAQQYMKDIEDQGIEVEMSAKKKLGRLFNASAQSLLDSKSSPSHQLGTDARRSSI